MLRFYVGDNRIEDHVRVNYCIVEGVYKGLILLSTKPKIPKGGALVLYFGLKVRICSCVAFGISKMTTNSVRN